MGWGEKRVVVIRKKKENKEKFSKVHMQINGRNKDSSVRFIGGDR